MEPAQRRVQRLCAGTRGVGARAGDRRIVAHRNTAAWIEERGLQDWASEIDMRKLTLAEITLIGTYTYSTSDLRAAALHPLVVGRIRDVGMVALHEGAIGGLDGPHAR